MDDMSGENYSTKETYKPVWDNWSIVITAIGLVIIFVLVGGSFKYEELGYKILIWAVALVLFSCFFLFPYRVSLEEGNAIKLSFIGYSRRVDLDQFKLIASGREYAKGSIRLVASGGLFGYPRLWLLKNGKTFTSYLTNFRHNVRFLSDGKKIIALNAPKEWFDEEVR